MQWLGVVWWETRSDTSQWQRDVPVVSLARRGSCSMRFGSWHRLWPEIRAPLEGAPGLRGLPHCHRSAVFEGRRRARCKRNPFGARTRRSRWRGRETSPRQGREEGNSSERRTRKNRFSATGRELRPRHGHDKPLASPFGQRRRSSLAKWAAPCGGLLLRPTCAPPQPLQTHLEHIRTKIKYKRCYVCCWDVVVSGLLSSRRT